MKYRIISKYVDDKLHLYLNLDNGDVYELGQNTDPITLKTVFSALSGNLIGIKHFLLAIQEYSNSDDHYAIIREEITAYCSQHNYKSQYGRDRIPTILALDISEAEDPLGSQFNQLGITYKTINGKFYYNTISTSLVSQLKLNPEWFKVGNYECRVSLPSSDGHSVDYTATDRGWVPSTEVNPEQDKPYESDAIDAQVFGDFYVGSEGDPYSYGQKSQLGDIVRLGTIIDESGSIIPILKGKDSSIKFINNGDARYWINTINSSDDLEPTDHQFKGSGNADLFVKGVVFIDDLRDNPFNYPGYLGRINLRDVKEGSASHEFIKSRPDLLYKLMPSSSMVLAERTVAGVKLVLMKLRDYPGDCLVFDANNVPELNDLKYHPLDGRYNRTLNDLIRSNYPIGVINIDNYPGINSGNSYMVRLERSQGKLLINNHDGSEVISEYGQPTVLVTKDAEKAKTKVLDKDVLLIDGPLGRAVSSSKDPNHIDVVSITDIKAVDHKNYYLSRYIGKVMINELAACLADNRQLPDQGVAINYPHLKYFGNPQQISSDNLYDVLDLLSTSQLPSDGQLANALQNLSLDELRVRYTDCYVLLHHNRAAELTEDNVIVGYRYGKSLVKDSYKRHSHIPLFRVDYENKLIYTPWVSCYIDESDPLHDLISKAHLPNFNIAYAGTIFNALGISYKGTSRANYEYFTIVGTEFTMVSALGVFKRVVEVLSKNFINLINAGKTANSNYALYLTDRDEDDDDVGYKLVVEGDSIRVDTTSVGSFPSGSQSIKMEDFYSLTYDSLVKKIDQMRQGNNL